MKTVTIAIAVTLSLGAVAFNSRQTSSPASFDVLEVMGLLRFPVGAPGAAFDLLQVLDRRAR